MLVVTAKKIDGKNWILSHLTFFLRDKIFLGKSRYFKYFYPLLENAVLVKPLQLRIVHINILINI